MSRVAPLVLGLALVAGGCGESASAGGPASSGGAAGQGASGASGAAGVAGASGASGAGGAAGATSEYPAGPYGAAVGDVLADYAFAGYVNLDGALLSTALPYADPVTFGQLRQSGRSHALVHLSEFF